jgi:hypothetical protein
MAANRWDEGKPEIGADFDAGFVSPWNANTRNFSDFATIQTNPVNEIPNTMAEQMDGDEHTTWAASGGRKRRGR